MSNDVSAAGGVRGGIRPHLQAFITSIVAQRAIQFNGYIETQMTSNLNFCQASMTLNTGDSQNDYSKDLVKNVQHALSDTRLFLQTMEFDSKRSAYREVVDMKASWMGSIHLEVDGVKTALTAHSEKSGVTLKDATDLKGKTTGIVPAAVLDNTDGKHELKSDNDATVKGRLDKGVTHAYSSSSLDSIASHATAAQTNSTNYVEQLQEVQGKYKALFEEQLTYLLTNTGFSLKWPSDFIEDKFKTMMEAAGATEDSAGSAIATSYKEWTSSSASQANPTDPLDSFTLADTDGAILIGMILGDAASIDSSSWTSPSEKMDKLTTLLNVLQIRRLGLEDSRKSLNNLIGLVREQMATLITTIGSSLDGIKAKLGEKQSSIVGVYTDAKTFLSEDDNAFISDGSANDDFNFSTVLNELQAATNGPNKNLHNSLKPRAKYLVNVIRQLHAYLISLLAAHGKWSEGQSAPEGLSTSILTATDQAVKYSCDDKQEANTLKDKLTTFQKNAKVTADCTLYSKVDGLVNLQDLTTNKLDNGFCTAAHNFGIDEINKMKGEESAVAKSDDNGGAQQPVTSSQTGETVQDETGQ